MVYTRCKCGRLVVPPETAEEMQQRIQTLEKRVCEQRKVNAGLHRTCDAHAKLIAKINRMYNNSRALTSSFDEYGGSEEFAKLQHHTSLYLYDLLEFASKLKDNDGERQETFK